MIVNKRSLIDKLDKTVITKNYEVMPSKQGGFTVVIKNGNINTFLHSKYNPIKTGEQFAASAYTDNDIVVYGLGLGYHIAPLAKMLKEGQKLYVFESSYITTKIAFDKTDIIKYLERENVVFMCSENLNEIAVNMDEAVNSADGKLVVYDPSLNAIPKHMEKLKDILFEYKSALNMRELHMNMMNANREINLNEGYKNGIKLFGKSFQNIPAILVSAGPSLDLNAKELVWAKDKAIILCVTRAAKTLEKCGVTPDFYIAADAGAWLKTHLNFETMDIPLFLLCTTDSDAKNYKGKKLLLFEKGSDAQEAEGCFVEAGGSVATVGLSLLKELGANPIIFVGQDLCYAFDKSHSGILYGKQKMRIKSSKSVMANDGNEYFTSGSLYIFLKWIERFIARNKNVTFLNATALGAVIEGAKNIELNILKQLPNVRAKIDNIKHNLLLRD